MDIEKLFHKSPQRYSYEQLNTFTKEFSVPLGCGAYGEVFKGILHDDDVQVAIKVFKSSLLPDEIQGQFKTEVSILGNTHHINVINLRGFCFEEKMKAIVYEFMENESLHKFLSGNQSIEWETLCMIATGTAKGLSYLHEDCKPVIIHYDIKPSNILLDSNFIPKVGDFGSAKYLDQGKTHITQSGVRGTRGYIAPEFNIMFSSITHKCDVFSYGITLFDIISGKDYFLNQGGPNWFPSQVWKKFKEGHQEEFMEECCIHKKNREQAKRMFFIALWCVQHLPADRPSMGHVVRLLEGKEELTLPNDPQYVGSSSRTQTESSTSQDLSLEKCVMIRAKELVITWGNTPNHWIWTSDEQSRFPEVAQLLDVYLLYIRVTVGTERLLTKTMYVVYLVFKIARKSQGLNLPAKVTVKFAGGEEGASGTHRVYLNSRGIGKSRVTPTIRQMSCERRDGWMEVEMGEFDSDGPQDGEVEVSLLEDKRKKGLIVEGIELRPKM